MLVTLKFCSLYLATLLAAVQIYHTAGQNVTGSSILSQSQLPVTVPVQIIPPTASDATCPNETQLMEARQMIRNEVSNILNPDPTDPTQDNPASSCSAIPSNRPSGYYWILPATGPPAMQIYCDFNRQCGCNGPSTWTRVGFLNMSDPDQNCPGDLEMYSTPIRACGRGLTSFRGCSSLLYSTLGQSYNRVCGRVLGYQNSLTLALRNTAEINSTIEERYLDGVSLTHGAAGSRQHIWSFASALGQRDSLEFNPASLCACTDSGDWPYSTSFIGNDYFCDSGNAGPDQINIILFPDDPLWDGEGCISTNNCCEFNSPPWFCKTLPEPTTDDLEIRLCAIGASSGISGDVPVQLIELYIQ